MGEEIEVGEPAKFDDRTTECRGGVDRWREPEHDTLVIREVPVLRVVNFWDW